MRTNRLVPSSGMGAAATKRSPLLTFGCRKYGRKNLDALENRFAGIWLFGNWAPLRGSVILVEPKLPASSDGLIAKELNNCSVRMRVSSKLVKKNIMSFLIGPPALPPN